jgi:DNA protecting protein DprA
MERDVGVTVGDLTHLYVLESVKQFGPQKFKELHKLGIRPADLLEDPGRVSTKGKRWDAFRSDLRSMASEVHQECRERAVRQILTAYKHKAVLLTYDHREYPRNVYDSNNPIPVLFARGAIEVLKERKVIACVGSRNIRPPYSQLQAEFARVATRHGFTIVSGFALGADTIGHKAALANEGRTICVMPAGLERPFPPENRSLWEELLASHLGLFVTEFGFGVRASSLTLRKRNKLIVAFAKGVLIGQSSVKGGAMNAYRFAREQRKPIATFSEDGTAETTGNLQIAREQKAGDEIFPTAADIKGYERWLQKLSSST